MTEPTTVNGGLIIPNTGDLPGTWGSNAINPDLVALDGQFYGVQTVSLSNASVVLTGPSGFTATPSPGPTQAQNAVLRLTGAMTANLSLTLPLPGYYIVQNSTTGNFTVLIRAINGGGSAGAVCVDQGEIQHVFSDGTNVYFVNLGRVGVVEMWAGISAMPAWVSNSTPTPYLLCDGTVYNFSGYPYLGKRLGSTFGGNGVSTFGVPDLRGRVALPYDGSGTRITTAGSGLNGQVLGASLDEQTISLIASQIPQITSVNAAQAIGVTSTSKVVNGPNAGSAVSGGTQVTASDAGSGGQLTTIFSSANNAISVASNNTGGGAHPNVQPSQVTGLAVIRAA